MRFWDASAVVPLLVPEELSPECADELAADRAFVVWALTTVEVLSAIHRQYREGRLNDSTWRSAQRRLDALRSAWSEVRDLDLVAPRAERLLAVHSLRAADALQLAAALVACDEKPRKMSFVCLDRNLKAAASREGFQVLPP